MIHETEQDYKLEIRDSQSLAENEEQRNVRLQRLRESQSIRIQAETKQQYHEKMELRGQLVVLSSGEMAAVSKSTFDLRISLVKLKCFKEYNTQIITGLIVDLY